MSFNKSIVIEAPAKINLYLEVLGVREDGYHDIRSVVAPVSLYDILHMEDSDGHVETITDISPELINMDGGWSRASDDNIVTAAVYQMKKETGYAGGVRIRIEKNIPVGGGLGGGSADAAAALRGLNSLWGLDLPVERLQEIGARLGCDVPGLVHGGWVCIEGLGERVTPLDIANNDELWLVIVNPCFPVSTGDIYSRCSSGLTSGAIPFSSMCSRLKERSLAGVSGALFNGLQETVFEKYPAIEIVAENLHGAGATGVLVSGSGASVFGLARDEGHAHDIDERVRGGSGVPVWSKVVRTLF